MRSTQNLVPPSSEEETLKALEQETHYTVSVAIRNGSFGFAKSGDREFNGISGRKIRFSGEITGMLNERVLKRSLCATHSKSTSGERFTLLRLKSEQDMLFTRNPSGNIEILCGFAHGFRRRSTIISQSYFLFHSTELEEAPVNALELALKAQRVREAVEAAVVGKSDVVEMALAILLSNGHLLIEDIPGVGKTTLAKAISRALGLEFKRIQFTPDLLPSDITGSSIFNQKTGEFEVYPGPVFANIVLADEINRSTPKTQAALLECMEERQVTIEGSARMLPAPFFVIATQNNIELSGTYPLPEAQLDRFAARISMGYPDRAAEQRILMNHRTMRPVDTIKPILSAEEIIAMQAAVREVHVDSSIQNYILDIVGATRTLPAVSLGASPRASLSLMYASQARAAIQGRDFVKPDDVKALAVSVLAHRVIVRPDQRIKGVTPLSCVQDILKRIPVPVGLN